MDSQSQIVASVGVHSGARLGSVFSPYLVRGHDLIAQTVMRSPWHACQWVETRDENGALVEISCEPPCQFELLDCAPPFFSARLDELKAKVERMVRPFHFILYEN